MDCTAPVVNYTINGQEYNHGYYLGDGIYPPYSAFVKTIPNPQTEKEKVFAAKQEACRKAVERAFGNLQIKFHLLFSSGRLWKIDYLSKVMTARIILHNMIIQARRNAPSSPSMVTLMPVSSSAVMPVHLEPSFEMKRYTTNYNKTWSNISGMSTATGTSKTQYISKDGYKQ